VASDHGVAGSSLPGAKLVPEPIDGRSIEVTSQQLFQLFCLNSENPLLLPGIILTPRTIRIDSRSVFAGY